MKVRKHSREDINLILCQVLDLQIGLDDGVQFRYLIGMVIEKSQLVFFITFLVGASNFPNIKLSI